MSRIREQRGVALAVTIFALVIVGALVAAAFFVGVQEQRIGRNTITAQQAFGAADGGAASIVTQWNTQTYNTMATGASVNVTPTSLPSGAGWYRGAVQRMSDLIFLVRAEGFSRDSSARQELGLIVRLNPLEINIGAALKTRGNTRIGGSSNIDGSDHLPGSWTACGPLKPTLPAILLPPADSAAITTSGCGGYSCLAGTPKIATDPTITDSSLTTFGDVQWNELAAMATKTIGPGTYTGVGPSISGSTCNMGVTKNWGDPLNPASACGNYFPIIYATGNVSINGNSGQGILLVDGDLSVQGGFEFFGPVVVKGTLSTTGTGGHFNGGVIAANTNLAQNTVLGNAVINYSSCAINRALTNSATGAIIRDRGWFKAY